MISIILITISNAVVKIIICLLIKVASIEIDIDLKTIDEFDNKVLELVVIKLIYRGNHFEELKYSIPLRNI